jgi:hypothetical protein
VANYGASAPQWAARADAERLYPGGHLCGTICSEILIGAGAYLPGEQMSKGTITAKEKA